MHALTEVVSELFYLANERLLSYIHRFYNTKSFHYYRAARWFGKVVQRWSCEQAPLRVYSFSRSHDWKTESTQVQSPLA